MCPTDRTLSAPWYEGRSCRTDACAARWVEAAASAATSRWSGNRPRQRRLSVCKGTVSSVATPKHHVRAGRPREGTRCSHARVRCSQTASCRGGTVSRRRRDPPRGGPRRPDGRNVGALASRCGLRSARGEPSAFVALAHRMYGSSTGGLGGDIGSAVSSDTFVLTGDLRSWHAESVIL